MPALPAAITVNSSNVNLSAAPGGSVFFSGGISGSGGITAASTGNGNVSLSNANTYTGSTTVSSGQLTLDYTNVTSGIVSASSNVILSGGTLAVNDSLAGPVNETFAATTISNFGSAFVVNLNSYQGVQINFNTITRTGGVLDLPVSGTGNLFTTANGNTNGILGGYMTVNGYTDWAANDGAGNIVAFASLPSNYVTDDYTSSANNVDVNNFVAPAGNATINSLRFNQPAGGTLTLGGQLTVATGGISSLPR